MSFEPLYKAGKSSNFHMKYAMIPDIVPVNINPPRKVVPPLR